METPDAATLAAKAAAEFARDSAFNYQIATQDLLKKRRSQVNTYTTSLNNRTVVKSGYNKRRKWSTTHDTIKIDFWDEKGFCGDSLDQYFVFDMDPSTSKIRPFRLSLWPPPKLLPSGLGPN
jgi:hypothetical protein